MLDEQEARGHAVGGAQGRAPAGEDLRRELEGLRLETRNYVKRKVRKSEKKLERSVREIDARTDALERRIDQVEAERQAAEWRIHNSTEQMLDGLLDGHPLDRRPPHRATRSGAFACACPCTGACTGPGAGSGRPGRPPAAAAGAPGSGAYSVEMLGSAWTLLGTTMRKFSGALAASSRIRTASSPWSVAFSSSA